MTHETNESTPQEQPPDAMAAGASGPAKNETVAASDGGVAAAAASSCETFGGFTPTLEGFTATSSAKRPCRVDLA